MGRLKIKPHADAMFRREKELRRLTARIKTPDQLAYYLQQIQSPMVRQAVFNRIRPWLKFKLPAQDDTQTSTS